MAGPRKAALAVIDVQEDFCEPNGTLAVKGGRRLANIWNDLLSRPFDLKIASKDAHPVDHISFASQHKDAKPFVSTYTVHNPENPDEEPFTFPLWPDHCVQGTQGCQLISELDVSKLTHIVEKGQDRRIESFSAFGPIYRKPAVCMTNLVNILKTHDIMEVFVVGLAYDFCVKHTAIDAAEHGFRTYIIEDATRAADQNPHTLEALRRELDEKGVRVIGLDSEELTSVDAT